LATKACELTEFEVVTPLDTLGAAYSEQGDFEKAMEYQRKAIELASPEERQALQDRLRGYASGQAYRDS
jgi:tetratricopeptide (TPR) repeat protein